VGKKTLEINIMKRRQKRPEKIEKGREESGQ
jgi:hypothetical protein